MTHVSCPNCGQPFPSGSPESRADLDSAVRDALALVAPAPSTPRLLRVLAGGAR